MIIYYLVFATSIDWIVETSQ